MLGSPGQTAMRLCLLPGLPSLRVLGGSGVWCKHRPHSQCPQALKCSLSSARVAAHFPEPRLPPLPQLPVDVPPRQSTSNYHNSPSRLPCLRSAGNTLQRLADGKASYAGRLCSGKLVFCEQRGMMKASVHAQHRLQCSHAGEDPFACLSAGLVPWCREDLGLVRGSVGHCRVASGRAFLSWPGKNSGLRQQRGALLQAPPGCTSKQQQVLQYRLMLTALPCTAAAHHTSALFPMAVSGHSRGCVSWPLWSLPLQPVASVIRAQTGSDCAAHVADRQRCAGRAHAAHGSLGAGSLAAPGLWMQRRGPCFCSWEYHRWEVMLSCGSSPRAAAQLC